MICGLLWERQRELVSTSAMQLRSINPKNGELVQKLEVASGSAIDQAVATADRGFKSHKRTGFETRAACLRELAEWLVADRAILASLLTDEMGKTLAAADAEIEKCAWVCRYYADNGAAMLADVSHESDAQHSAVINLPIGPVLAVMPWNFPFWQVFRAAVPAIMAGNVILLKHASNVPRTAVSLQSLFESAGFGPGVFQSLLIGPDQVERILADPRVKAATVTGSTRAGSSVAAIAGKHLKPTVLELGGSDPFIVMPSANLEAALETAVTARTLNNGQSCIAAKRFIVHTEVYDRFVGAFVKRFEALKVGDPADEATEIGPMAMDRLRQRLSGQVEKLLERGAERLTGAELIDGPGYFFRPGILAGIDPNAPAFDEELFGPVAWVLRVESIDEALTLANATQYGLGSSLWTQDQVEIERGYREIESGATFVNSMVKSDPRLPFGGIKQSGYGRELAREGILEFVNRKTIVHG